MQYTIRPSNRKDKKLDLVIKGNGKKRKTISFGFKGMSDFTLHKDPERKQRYMDRHHNEQEKGLWKDNKTNLQTPAYLAKNVLWNKPTIEASVKNIEKRLGVNIKIQK